MLHDSSKQWGVWLLRDLDVRWETFRALMRKRRKELGLTQTELAERMGRSQDFVSVLENNERSIPNLVTVWLWADALGGSMEAVFHDESRQVEA